jgi:hypothetical protein
MFLLALDLILISVFISEETLSDKNLERVLLLKLVTLTFITFSTIKLISKATIDTVLKLLE